MHSDTKLPFLKHATQIKGNNNNMTGMNSTDYREHHTNPNGHAQRKVGKLSEIGEDKRYVTQ